MTPGDPKGRGEQGRSLSGAHSGSGGAGGKSPRGEGKHTPALERVRGRNERAAARQERRGQLRADRQSAALADRTKDRDQDRDRRRRAAKDAQRAAKKETAARAKRAGDAERATLGQAVAEGAEDRWKKRRERGPLDPPIVTRKKKPKKDGGDGGPDGGAPPEVDLTKKPKTRDGAAGKDPADPEAGRPADPPEPAADPPAGAKPDDPAAPGAAAADGPPPGSTAGPGASPPPPGSFGIPGGFGGMRPPPGADRSYTVTLERDDPPPAPPAPAWAIGPAHPALPAAKAALPSAAATSSTPPAPAVPAVPAPRGARFVSTPVKTTQYKDAELTIYDVIDADADMSEEITEGVDEAIKAADGCERLISKLEALHAKVVELRVPGVLEGMVVRLLEKTETVKARAEAIAKALPRASESISTAGSNAESRHRHLADVTRDMGHVRPADRDYHNE